MIRYVGILIALLFACALYARGAEPCGRDGCPVSVKLVKADGCKCGDSCPCKACDCPAVKVVQVAHVAAVHARHRVHNAACRVRAFGHRLRCR